jgi:two-component system, NarL family, nitrate/nitrite response regulator NarL
MNILVVDDHPLTASGLAALLESSFFGARVQCVHSAVTAHQKLDAHVPSDEDLDWIFLDILLPDDPQRQLLERIRKSIWATRTILMSAASHPAVIRDALGSGIRGYIPKSADPATIVVAFNKIRSGEVYMSDELAQAIEGLQDCATVRGLSPRLEEVLQLVLKGQANKVIARELGISENTVKEYISSILAFHSVKNRLELVLKFNRESPPLR